MTATETANTTATATHTAAPATPEATGTTATTGTTEASRAVVQAYMDTLMTGDIPALKGFFTPTSTWTLAGDLPLSRTWTGPAEILEEFVPAMLARFEADSVEFAFDGLLADGDRVLAEWNTRARAKAGGRYDQHCLAVFTVADGRIAAVREYIDTLHARTVVFA